MADLTVDELRQMLKEALGTGNSAPPPPPAPGPAPAPAANNEPAWGILNTLIQKVDALITAITGSKMAETASKTSQVATAVIGLKDASNLASGAITNLAGKIPGIGTALEKAGVDLNEYLKIAREGTQIGVGQGNAADLQERAFKAGFKNVQEYLDYLKENYNNSLRTIGKSAEDSSQKLALVQQKVVNSVEGQNMLKRGLISPDQLAKIAGIAAEGKSAMLRSDEGRQHLAEETARLALKIEAQSQITGESTNKIIADNKARAETAEEQIRLQTLTNDNQRLQYIQNQQLMATQGKSMQDVMATIYTGGRLSKDQQAMLQAATGGRGGQLIQLIREQKRTSGLAAEDPRRIEADRRLADFTAKMSAYQASPQFARYINTTSNDAQRNAGLTLQRENKEKGPIKAIMDESQVTPAEARRRAIEYGLQQGRGFRQEGLTEKEQIPNVGAKPYETLFEANEQARKTVVAAAQEINKMNNALGRNTQALDDLRTLLIPIAGPTNQTQQQRDEMVREFFHGRPGANGPGIDPATGKPIEGTAPVVVQTPSVTVQSTGPVNVQTKPEGGRAHGTKGETGFDAEPKDAVLQIHKGETVLTPEQKEGMIKDSANSIFDKILGKKNSRDSEDQDVRYQQVDKNDPEFVKMRLANEAERAERAKFMRSREVADPMYAGGKRFETYDIREEEAKLKEKAAAQSRGPISIADIQKEMASGLSQEAAQQAVEARLDKAAALKELELKKENIPKVEIPKVSSSIKDPSQIKTPRIDLSYASRAEKMLGEQTQGIFGNLRTAFAKRQQQMGPNITEEFKNYQPKSVTVTPAGQPAPPPAVPKIEAKENVTIKDLNDQLMMLNKSIAQLVHSSTATNTFAEQHIRVTKKLSGNRFG